MSNILIDGFATDGVTPIPSTGRTPVESQPEINSDPAGSSTTIRRYNGLRVDIDALITALGIHGIYPYQVSQIGDSPTATLTVTYAGGIAVDTEPLSIEHVFRTGLSQVSLTQHDNYAPDLQALSRAQKSEFKKFQDGQITLDDYVAPTGPIEELAQMLAENVIDYQRPDPTYTFQARYHAGHNYEPSFARVGRVYDTSQLKTAFGIPDHIYNGMPVGLWMAMEVEYEMANDGSKSVMQSFTYADRFDTRIYAHG